MRVCYRPPNQENGVDETLCRQMGACTLLIPAPCETDLLNDYQRDNTAGQKRFQRFLKCVTDNFLTQVIEESTRRGAMLDLVLTNKKELVGNAALQGTANDDKMVETKILRAVRRACSKITAPDIRRGDLWPLQRPTA